MQPSVLNSSERILLQCKRGCGIHIYSRTDISTSSLSRNSWRQDPCFYGFYRW